MALFTLWVCLVVSEMFMTVGCLRCCCGLGSGSGGSSLAIVGLSSCCGVSVVVVLLVMSASLSELMESSSDDLLSWLSLLLLSDSDSDPPTPAIKGLSLSEWAVNLPRCRMTKDGLSEMWSLLAKILTCLMAAVVRGTS